MRKTISLNVGDIFAFPIAGGAIYDLILYASEDKVVIMTMRINLVQSTASSYIDESSNLKNIVGLLSHSIKVN